MKAIYRGYEIEVKRERCLAGYPLLYFSIVRLSDNYICLESFTDSDDAVRDMIGYMKYRIDAELVEADPWMEAGSLNPLDTVEGSPGRVP